MRTIQQIVSVVVLTLSFMLFPAIPSLAQVDTATVKKDTVPVTTQPVATTPTDKPKEKPKLILYAGPNVSTLRVESNDLQDESVTGFHAGISWRTKGFIYSQFGLRYNNPVYSILPAGARDSGDHKFSVSAIDVPITLGINILSATDKVLNLRGFISAMPSFNIGVGDNDYLIDKDDIETFVFYGQLGLGVDFLFLVFEVGYNYGFNDLFKDAQSKPGQGFINIGVRL